MSMTFYSSEDIISHLMRLKTNSTNETFRRMIDDIKDSIEINIPKYQSFKENSFWETYVDPETNKVKTRCAKCHKGNAIKSEFCPRCGCFMINKATK